MPEHQNSDDYSFQVELHGISLSLVSRRGLFSPRGLDAGTRALLNHLTLTEQDRVLDLGCGCGVVGIYAARRIGADQVVLADVDPVAVEVATQNAAANGVPDLCIRQSDGFRDFRDTHFTKILCNPPYHTDFSVSKHFIMKGFNRLVIGGEMTFVTKRDTWYRKKFSAVFGGHQCRRVDDYFLISAVKRRAEYASSGSS